ncbi:MAG: ribulose-phosphate 3-epimerase [Bacteroidia bacterium]|jgi:ribulose-phosphate 3-epimerase|nr:ribulose-phosphate 3-epimerase [Bacteroidia bacterium]
MTHKIAPSVLAADFANLQRDVEMINESEADWFHIDIMDGVFVPNISFGFPVMKAIQKHATKPLDVHLMIINPDEYIQACADAGAEVITVHYEACTHLHRTLGAIREAGCLAGVAINPHTPVHLLNDVFKDIDLICVMSVNPGFGGQKFIENTYTKLQQLKNISEMKNHTPYIQVDGGVNLDNYQKLLECGANVLVAGSSVFSSPKPAETILALKQ